MSTNPIVISPLLEKPRKRLIRQYRRLGSYHKVAEARGINVYYVWDFLVNGVIPSSKNIQHALGLRLHRPVTINQLMQLPIQDQPTEILRLAFENRMEMTNEKYRS
jgi:hypothetical protein